MLPELLLHWSLQCKHCGAPIWLLVGNIQPLSAPRESPANEFHAIAVADTVCKHVETYTLHQDSPGHSPKNRVILAEPKYGDVVPLGSLQCEAANCGILLPLLALWGRDTTLEERLRDTKTWNWANLRCPKGHAIRPVSFGA
jgi:hypothetical protein